jgi:hypothetical protein
MWSLCVQKVPFKKLIELKEINGSAWIATNAKKQMK